MSNASLINIGLSGVKAHQAALSTTGQNISNAATPGYSRQRVNFETQIGSGSSDGQYGVRVGSIERYYDAAAVKQERLDTSTHEYLATLAQQLEQVNNLLADDANNLNRGFERFFGALQSAANQPTSLPARELVLGEANGLVARFRSIDERLRSQHDSVQRQVGDELSRVNELTQSIAELNGRLVAQEGSQGNTNALLDQRDELLRALAERVDLKVVSSEGDGVNVFTGKGIPLVVGTEVTTLSMTSDGQIRQATGRSSGAAPLPLELSGGSLGGLLEFRDNTLFTTRNQLGRLAVSFAATINEVHSQGINLRGDYGGDLFADLNTPTKQVGRVAAANASANLSNAVVGVRIDDPSALTAGDYLLTFSDGNRFLVQRSSDGVTVAQGVRSADAPVEVAFDGMSLVVAGNDVRAGAEYRLSAAGAGVGDLSVALVDPRDLALAGPVSVVKGGANLGTGRLSLGIGSDVSQPIFGGDGRLAPPLLVSFTSASSYEILDNTDPVNPRQLSPPIWGMPYSPGSTQNLLPTDGQQLLQSNGPPNGTLPQTASQVLGLVTIANTGAAENVTVLRTDPELGSSTVAGQVAIAAGSSARAIASAMDAVAGVNASARTAVSITSLRSNTIGEPLTIVINGESLVLGPGAGLNELADAVSASATLRSAGITAKSDGTTLELRSNLGDDLALHVAGDVTEGITLRDARGGSLDLNGSGPPLGGNVSYQTATISGEVRLLLDADVSLDSASATGGLFSGAPEPVLAGLGLQLTMTGRPESGDRFEVDFNEKGNLDNFNALALAELQVRPSLGDPPANFTENYAQLIERVGLRTNQARTDEQASSGLLEQSRARRESVSGVNLDEEAANLIRFEQGYNAAARVVAIARETFQVLLSAIG